MNKLIFYIVLVCNLLLQNVMGHAKIVLARNSFYKVADEYRNHALLRERAVELFGWDWYFEHFVYNEFALSVYLIETAGESGLMLRSSTKHPIQFYDQIKRVFDLMSERNDTVFSMVLLNINEKKANSDPSFLKNYMREEAARTFINALNNARSKGAETYWIGGDMSTYPITLSKAFYFGIFVFPRLYSKELRERYALECQEKHLRNLYKLNRFNTKDFTNEEIELLKKYLILSDEESLSKPLPQNKYIEDFWYDNIGYPGNLHKSLIIPIK